MEKISVLKEILEWGYCIIIAIVLALLVKYYIGTPTIVQQQSMQTTFMPNDRLILSRITRTAKGTYERGDIITFEAPSTTVISAANINYDYPIAEYKNEDRGLVGKFFYNVLEVNKISYIKRIIAVEGDHLELKDGKVYLNGERLEEDYLDEGVTTKLGQSGLFSDIVVPNDCVYVMGDNRDHSTDSRSFGCIPVEKIEGKVWVRFWPLSKFGTVE